MVLRNFQRDEVCLSFFQTLEKFRRIAYGFHTELGTDGNGKVFGQFKLQPESFSLIFIIGVGAGQRDGYQFAGFLYLV